MLFDQWNTLTTPRRITSPQVRRFRADWRQIDGFIFGRHWRPLPAPAISEGKHPASSTSRRPAWLCDVRLFKHGTAKSTLGDSITEGTARPRHPGHRNREGRRCLPDFDEEAVGDLTCSSTACPGGSTINIAGAISFETARTASSSPSSPIPATAISQSCSIRVHAFQEPPVPEWLRSAQRSTCRSRRCEREL